MNNWIWFLRGYLIIELTGATPQWALNRLTQQRIPFWSVSWLDEFTVRLAIPRSYLKEAERCIGLGMCHTSSCWETGAPKLIKSTLHRPVMLIFLVLSALIVGLLPQFVLFYQVIGNDAVPETQILRALDEIGVSFGIYGPDIDPERISNQVLKKIPELEWITVNQNGCRAQVIIRERPDIPEIYNRKGLANVVATKSGVITKQSILAGQAVHQVGDTVLEGDLLVSGMVDLERTCTVEYARAEIFAKTWRKSETVIPKTYGSKVYSGETETTVWLCIGEKRMKIFGNSGISPWNCDKITNKKSLQLPGGLLFPVSVEIETRHFYETKTTDLSSDQATEILQTFTEQTAVNEMIAGQILQRRHQLIDYQGCYRLNTVLECHEMIGKSVQMQWNTGGNSRDRTNGER